MFEGQDPQLVSWVLIPIVIFFSRVADVTIGTLRIVFVSKGWKRVAPLLGFFEVLIWIVAMSQILKYANNWPSYLAWAGGFAVGNYIGLWIEEQLAIGNLLMRVITPKPALELVQLLREAGFGVTRVDAQGAQGDVNLIFTLVQRRDLPEAIRIVQNFHPQAFYTVEDVRYTSDKVFSPRPTSKRSVFGLGGIRVGK
jgi:uncharacterized protein YebE (UPF0316 family)